jgi:hypothetical protein
MAEDAEDKVHEGIEHLQAAAREVIQATRSLLDAAEELLEDPRSVQDLVGTLAHAAQAAATRFGVGVSGARPDGGDDDGPVQRIKVS